MTVASARRPRWPAMALVMAGLVVALIVAGLFSSTQTGPQTPSSAIGGAGLALMFLTLAAVGLIVARHQPRNPIGFLLLGADSFFLLTLDGGSYAMLVYPLHHRLPLGVFALMLNPLGIAAVVMLPLVVVVFPDGQLPSRPWRVLLRAAIALAGYSLAVQEISIVAAVFGHHARVNSDGTPALTGPLIASASWRASSHWGCCA